MAALNRRTENLEGMWRCALLSADRLGSTVKPFGLAADFVDLGLVYNHSSPLPALLHQRRSQIRGCIRIGGTLATSGKRFGRP